MINNILISRETRKMLSKENRFLGMEGENLQETLVFNLDRDLEGTALIEIQFPDESKGFVEVEKTEQGYELPVKSSLLTQKGVIKMQLRILQSGQEIFKSETIRFNVEKSINATATIPDEYPTWIDNLEILKADLEKAESKRTETFTQMQKEVEEAISNIEDMTEKYNTNAAEKTNEFNDNVTSQTETFNQNAQAKIDEYNANVQIIEPRIIELETQVAKLETENETLKNQIPTGQESEENITLNDSSDMKFKEFKVTGNSKQETRSGKNILLVTATSRTVAGVEFTVNEDGSITINGTNTGTSNITFQLCNAGKLILEANSTYKIIGQSGVSGVMLQATYYKNGTRVYATADNEFTTVEESIDTSGTGAYVYIRVNVGVTVSNLTIYPMVMLSSETDQTYEQYGKMPSQEFPSEIKNMTGAVNITVSNGLENTDTDYQEQIFTFPLAEGQKLGRRNEKEYDYLSDEGIINILEQTDETGTKTIEESFEVRETPLVIAYTEEQQAVYDKIKKATSYKNITHIFSTDETSPVFEVTYRKDQESINKKQEDRLLALENAVLGGN